MEDRDYHSRWTVVAGGLIVQIILGTVYAFSVFVKPLEIEFGWGRTTTQWAFSFALLSFAIVMIPAGRLQDRIGPRKVASIGGILLGLSFILSAFTVHPGHPWTLYLTYGVLGGAGIGFAYVCPIAAATKWYPEKKGLIAGLSVAGFGAGALFFAGPASSLLLPPTSDGEAFGLSQILLIGLGIAKGGGFGIGWKAFFILHGVVCAGAVVAGAALLRNPPEGWSPPGWQAPEPAKESAKETEWRDMLNTPLACMLWLTFIFGATSGLMAIGQWKPMMTSILEGRTFAPEWMGGFGRFVEPVGILAIFNALGRIFWGKVSDIIDRPRAMMMMFLAQGMAFMLLVSVNSVSAIFLASAWVGLNFGGNFALFPSATSDYFGAKNFGSNYGWIFTAYGVAGILGPVVGGVLFDSTKGYLTAFVFAGILCFVAAGTSVTVWMMGKQREKELGF
ncbi:MAG: OFA family MFS transporter [Nitrospinaceae bacterium]|nr:OFA family MFS transporter [Nitrospinaceae bacterium]MBT4095040.1 OFA family MFS transporter [Nitrospinaceae bacterium]MBT4431698.1 OFA family MFS transporter [Nitrospinaceae bacterium]MBT5368185.1 OFA family MFS transporter [Nitrospinaceae bacterium]MBT6395782.1 OFA family MFS transporter [Nitrospinaceae bacterium]